MGWLNSRSSAVFVALLVAGCQTAPKAENDEAAKAEAEAKSGGSQVDRLVKLASDIEKRGESGTAIALYEKAMALPEARTTTFVKAGDAYLKAGYTKQAIKAYHAALAKSPNDGPALLGLGAAMLDDGDKEAGIRALAQAAPVVNTSSAYNRLAVAQTFAGQSDAAQNTFAQALKLAPGDIDIETNMALNAALGGNAATALPLVKRIESSSKAQLHHKRNVVVIYGLLGMADQAQGSPPTGLTSEEVRTLLKNAKTIRAKATAAARAQALGAMMV